MNDERFLCISDSVKHEVRRYQVGETVGVVVAGGYGKVMRWCNGAMHGDIILGGNGHGEQANQFNYPEALVFDRDGNLYIADGLNHRIQRFNIQKNSY